uniref:Reverse transcriptase domain, reverse transcriptase zinc-binding domain protein n=1 Tax=Tanacetum cinerariifolium TaxID=118510 RepID=A0A6L2L9T7_TANCI|nr:reverse transcriptase domain, reverse transcriptase zinc-binding domain protein [Tanacetum cinerariifolium]GEU99006.1 reverse transcriptase domain, reverse transcriptase zinc-binding domain protein [Tanacetum cinerariifolium]
MACMTLTSFSLSIIGDIHGFFKDVDLAQDIMDSLEEFKRTSGLVPSIANSMAFFCNVLNHAKLAILHIMPFLEGKLLVKYLGVSLISSKLLNKDCKILVEKAKNRSGDWKNKWLSFAGRLQLCKSVISFMHVYWASVLVTPKGQVPSPNMDNNRIDSFRWRDLNRNMNEFFVKGAWEAIKPKGLLMAWH